MSSIPLGILWFVGGAILLIFYTITNHQLRKWSKDAFWLAGGILGCSGMAAFAVAGILLAVCGPHYHFPPLQVFGGILIVSAGLLWFWSMLYVGRLRGPRKFSLLLSMDGPYRYVRHPQALALCGLTLGLGLITLSKPLLFGFPVWAGFWVLYAHLEEQLDLIPSYGSSYLRYCHSTPRLLPFFKDWKNFLYQGRLFFRRVIESK
jgi:protein-S-isoprenylcysteine O-methyltransferase Ste14